MRASPWSLPPSVPPSARKCLAVARIAVPSVACSKPRMAAAPRLATSSGDLAEALVGAPPALVARDREAGREVPVDAGAGDLARGDARGGLDDRGIARAAHADVVREDRRALDRAVAVDGVDAVEHRDPEPRRQRLALVAIVHLDPGGGLVGLGQRIGARQHRAEQEVVNFLAVLERFHVGLGHLADLFVQRHLRQQRLDVGRRQARLARGGDVRQRWAAASRPAWARAQASGVSEAPAAALMPRKRRRVGKSEVRSKGHGGRSLTRMSNV